MATRILGVVLGLLIVGPPTAWAQDVRPNQETSTPPSGRYVDFGHPPTTAEAPFAGTPAPPSTTQRTLAPSLAMSSTDYTIGGKVRDEQTRVPIAQAHITVLDAQTGETLQDGITTDAEGRYEATVSTTDTGTDVEDQPDVPGSYWVSTPSPHPISAAYAQPVTLRYTAPDAQAGSPELEVFDLQGRRLDPSRSLAGGLYFYRLRFPDGQVTNTASFVRLGSGPLRVDLVRLSGDAPGTSSTQQAGKTSLTSLEVTLVIEKTGYQTLEQNASLDEATATEVNLRLMPNTPLQQPDEVTYDVEYASGAVVMEGAAMDALVEADTAQHRFVFDTDALQQSNIDLQADQVILIEGVTLGRITDVQQDGSDVVVETEEATLNEAIRDGTIGWEKTIDYTDYRTAQLYAGKQACVPEKTPTKVTFTCSSDPYTFTLEFKPGQGVTETKVEVKKAVGNNTDLRMTGIGKVRDITTGGTVSYSGGEMEDMDLGQDNVRAEMRLEIAAVGSGNANQKFELPTPAFNFPFTVGPIPMHLSIGAELVFKLEVPLSAQASATASVDLNYDADHGFTYEGSDVDVDASLNGYDISEGNFDSASNFAYVDAQYGVAFPRIGFSILANEVAWVRIGFTTGTRLEFGPVCKTGYGRVLVDGGYGLSFFGVDLTTPQEINLIDKQKRTDGCDN